MEMILENPNTLAIVRMRCCLFCRKPKVAEAHHILAKGMDAGHKLELQDLIAPACIDCHGLIHSGKISQMQVYEACANRMRVPWQALLEATYIVRRTEPSCLDLMVDQTDDQWTKLVLERWIPQITKILATMEKKRCRANSKTK